MTACFSSHSRLIRHSFGSSAASVLIGSVFIVSILVPLVRGRMSPADLADLDPRLMGPDVLGERMVVPPGIPDWVFMDCETQKSNENLIEGESTLINRVQQSICQRG
jgi:hypothetical protein